MIGYSRRDSPQALVASKSKLAERSTLLAIQYSISLQVKPEIKGMRYTTPPELRERCNGGSAIAGDKDCVMTMRSSPCDTFMFSEINRSGLVGVQISEDLRGGIINAKPHVDDSYHRRAIAVGQSQDCLTTTELILCGRSRSSAGHEQFTRFTRDENSEIRELR